jgi:hypothetical protein
MPVWAMRAADSRDFLAGGYDHVAGEAVDPSYSRIGVTTLLAVRHVCVRFYDVRLSAMGGRGRASPRAFE